MEVGMPVPDKVYLFHLTAIDNLKGIIESGGLKSKNRLRDGEYRSVAYSGIQERRARRHVPCAAGGSLHDYVPFYFGPRPPMLYAIHEGRVEGYDEGQEPILHLVTRLSQIEQADLTYAFTDLHAVMEYARFFDRRSQLHQVDHELMKKRYWADTDEQPDRKARRQAEFLAYDFVPFSVILGIVVINESMRSRTEAHLEDVHDPPEVLVKRNWYY